MGNTTDTSKVNEAIINKAYEAMVGDGDVGYAADTIARHLRRLLDACEISEKSNGEGRDEYTIHLVDAYIGLVAAPSHEIYGSAADYCAQNALSGFRGYKVRLTETAEADEILHEIRVGIYTVALEPRRMFGAISRSGIPIGRKKFLRG